MRQRFVNGYTLIEILVSLSIIGLLFSFGYVNFREFQRRQSVLGIARQLKGDIRFAQQSAISGDKPDSTVSGYTNCVAPNVLNGYYFRSSGTSYTIEANCSIPGNPVTVSVTVKTTTLPTDVSLSVSSGSPNPILFKSLGQGTNIATGSQVTVTITDASFGGSALIQDVIVTAGGEIK